MKYDSVKASSAFMFMEVQRIHAHKKILLKVLNPEYFEQFICFVLGHSKIENKYKLIILLELCSGSRISEILDLKKKDVIVDSEGGVTLKIMVKKKRREKLRKLHRMSKVHGRVGMLLRKWMLSLGDDELLFKTKQRSARVIYNSMFGISPHALRHSFIIWCYDKQGMKIEEIVNRMVFSSNTSAQRYYNTRVDVDTKDLFKDMT